MNNALDVFENTLGIKLWKEKITKNDWSCYTNKLNDLNIHRLFIIITDVFGWNYLIWSPNSFDDVRCIVAQLSQKIKLRVNYFFCDMVIPLTEWVFAENGVIIRAYNNGGINMGCSEEEEEIRNRFDDEWDIFWELYKKTAQTIEAIDELKVKEITVYVGEFSGNNSI